MVMLGGYGTVSGPLIGAFLYEELRGLLLDVAHHLAAAACDRRARCCWPSCCSRRAVWSAPSISAGRAPEVPAMSALLEVNALSKRFGGVHAVADLTFTVGKGEILGLIGPNGAGKSTVFNLINGVFPPDSGRIIFEGTDITGEPPYEVAHHGIARAHQIVQPLAGLSVLDNCTGRRLLRP